MTSKNLTRYTISFVVLLAVNMLEKRSRKGGG